MNSLLIGWIDGPSDVGPISVNTSSVHLVEELYELLKIYFVIRFYARNSNHS